MDLLITRYAKYTEFLSAPFYMRLSVNRSTGKIQKIDHVLKTEFVE